MFTLNSFLGWNGSETKRNENETLLMINKFNEIVRFVRIGRSKRWVKEKEMSNTFDGENKSQKSISRRGHGAD